MPQRKARTSAAVCTPTHAQHAFCTGLDRTRTCQKMCLFFVFILLLRMHVSGQCSDRRGPQELDHHKFARPSATVPETSSQPRIKLSQAGQFTRRAAASLRLVVVALSAKYHTACVHCIAALNWGGSKARDFLASCTRHSPRHWGAMAERSVEVTNRDESERCVHRRSRLGPSALTAPKAGL